MLLKKSASSDLNFLNRLQNCVFVRNLIHGVCCLSLMFFQMFIVTAIPFDIERLVDFIYNDYYECSASV